jgi:hypothetical protein
MEQPIGLAALDALGKLGQSAKAAGPDLLALLPKLTEAQRLKVGVPLILALNKVGLDPKEAVPVMSKILKYDTKELQFQAELVTALGMFGKDARDALPSLEAAFESALGQKLPKKFTKKDLGKMKVIAEFKFDRPWVITEEAEFSGHEGLLLQDADEFCATVVNSLQRIGLPGDKAISLVGAYCRGKTFEAWVPCPQGNGDYQGKYYQYICNLVSAKKRDPKGLQEAIRLLGQLGTNEAKLQLRRLELSDDEAIREAAKKALAGETTDPSK